MGVAFFRYIEHVCQPPTESCPFIVMDVNDSTYRPVAPDVKPIEETLRCTPLALQRDILYP